MLVENQKIWITLNFRNKEWFKNKGYETSSNKIEVLAKDLMPTSDKKVWVICDYCGKKIEKSFSHYVDGRKNINKDSCKDCKLLKKSETTLFDRQKLLYQKIQKSCFELGYELISKQEDIKCNTTYVDYKCPKHGIKQMRVSNLIIKRHCPDCNVENNKNKYKLSDDEVCFKIELCGGKWINVGGYINRYEKNLLITCPICGEPFQTSFILFTQHGGQKCENCNTRLSIGENIIYKYLENSNIDFKYQHWFDDCRDINPLPFDFYLPKYNMCIEFDGRQHFEETNYFSYSLEKTQNHDFIKNKYCSDNNIQLIRINYKDINNIEKFLKEKIFT